MDDSEIFEVSLVQNVKTVSQGIIKEVNDFWRGQEVAFNDTTLTNAIQNLEVIVAPADNTKPEITLLGNSNITLLQGTTYSDAGATASDNQDGDITANIVVNNPVDNNTLGTYTVTYDVTDSSANVANQVTRTVTVVFAADTTKPLITLLGDSNITLIQGTQYSDAGATASDDRDGDITASIVMNNPVDSNTIGTYTITYDVNDSSANIASQVTRTVIVTAVLNSAPTITGTPNNKVYIYETYRFTPIVNTSNGDLTFSISNKPSWAEFNSTTGVLSGQPLDGVGVYSDIIISVSNQETPVVSLAPFSIEVKEARNIAKEFGEATQGGTYGSFIASYAIDGNLSTFNHTKCNESDNWWQLELPIELKVAKVVIHNRSKQTARLNGTKMYIGTDEYNGTLIEDNYVETLTGSSSAQIFSYDEFKEGTHLLLKADAGNCLHVSEVEVYGATPATPVFEIHNSNYLIQGTTASSTVVTTLNAKDYQEDTLTYSIIGDVPFSIDTQGNITVNGSFESSSYTFDVEVSDGVNTSTTTLTVNITSDSAVEDVLVSGDIINTLVTEGELLQSARDEIATLEDGNALLKQLYKDEAISYDPTNRSQLIDIVGDAHKIFPILYGNNNRVLAAAGQKENSRFAAFGAAPMEHFQDGNNQSYEIQFKRLLSWLIANNVDANVSNTTIGLSFTRSDKKDIKAWIGSNYPEWTIQECDRENPDFSTCYNNVDLIITGWQTDESNRDAVRTKLEEVVSDGTPVLYLHTWQQSYNSVAHSIAELFGFSLPYRGNYLVNDKVAIDSVEAMQTAFFDNVYKPMDVMLKHFQDEDYNFDWSKCKDGSGAGSKDDDCSEVVGLNSDFEQGATKVQEMMIALDSSKKRIFSTTDYRLQKLLALIGDKFRQKVI